MCRVALFCLLLFGALLPGASAQVVLHFRAEAGNELFSGQHPTLTAAQYNFDLNPYKSANYVGFLIHDAVPEGSLPYYSLDFAAPFGVPLRVGNYDHVERYLYPGSVYPELSFSGQGVGSGYLEGDFQVFELTYDTQGNVATFAADFLQYSDSGPVPCFGQIRYHSAVPYANAASAAWFADDIYQVLATAGDLPLKVERPAGATGPLTVAYATSDGTDLAGRDYTATGGTLTWADGDTAPQRIDVPILNSGNPDQGNGRFYVTLTGPGVATRATVLVVNDDSAITFFHYSSDPADYVGGGRDETLSIRQGVQIGPGVYDPDSGDVSVLCAPADVPFLSTDEVWYLAFAQPIGQSFVPGDYEGATKDPGSPSNHPEMNVGSTRAAPTLTGNFQVLEAEFATDGGVQKLAINFEQHADGGVPALRGQLRYRSTAPLQPIPLTLTVPTASVDDSGTTTGVFKLTRAGDLSQPLTVAYTLGGTASNGQDYQTLTGTQTIKAGHSGARILIRPVHTGATGTVKVQLTVTPKPGWYELTGPGSAKVKIHRSGPP